LPAAVTQLQRTGQALAAVGHEPIWIFPSRGIGELTVPHPRTQKSDLSAVNALIDDKVAVVFWVQGKTHQRSNYS
jgi:hypothetical protein